MLIALNDRMSLTYQQLVRDAKHSVTDLMSFGQQILGRRHVDPSVLTMLQQLQVEGTFVTGTHLITVDQPISSDEGDLRKALYGSYLAVPSKDDFPPFDDALYEDQNRPGAIVVAQAEPIELNAGRKRVRVKVTNKGDRAVQVSPLFVIFYSLTLITPVNQR
jgi:urease